MLTAWISYGSVRAFLCFYQGSPRLLSGIPFGSRMDFVNKGYGFPMLLDHVLMILLRFLLGMPYDAIRGVLGLY